MFKVGNGTQTAVDSKQDRMGGFKPDVLQKMPDREQEKLKCGHGLWSSRAVPKPGAHETREGDSGEQP